MNIYRVHLELQSPLYFATRELGRLYVTEQYLHNYALTYALGFARSTYHDLEHIPHYQEDLEPLNSKSVYVTPACPISSDYVTHTYKWAKLRYHIDNSEQTSKNIPTFGRIRELAPESQFEFFAISRHPLTFPRWIRLGKWMSKTEVTVKELPFPKRNSAKEFTFPYSLNPLDVMFTNQIVSYDTINMPPVSLIRNVRMVGEFYSFEGLKEPLKLPAKMEYRFSSQ